MEVFLEKKTSEWFLKLQKDKQKNTTNISKNIKKAIIYDTLEKITEDFSEHGLNITNKKRIQNFNILTDPEYPLEFIEIDFKLPLNAHGGNEIKKLLNKIGIPDIYTLIDETVEEDTEVISEIELSTKFDYEGCLNKLIRFRNIIAHDDLFPSISFSDINDFIKGVNDLGKTVIKYLESLNEDDIILEAGC